MSRNLYDFPLFKRHNFSDQDSALKSEPNPDADVLFHFNLPKSRTPDPHLIGTLSFTLSPLCCASFRRAHPDLPFTDRDYYLSTVFKFLYLTMLDRSDRPDYWDLVRPKLEAALDTAFHEDFASWERLSDLDWVRIFEDYGNFSWEVLIRRLSEYLTPEVGESQKARRQRGRPRRFAARQIEDARLAKEAGKTNRDAAVILYGKYPTAQQVKNVPGILKHHKNKLARG